MKWPDRVVVCLGLGFAACIHPAQAQLQPAALVEYASGLEDVNVQETQFVYPGQRIELGKEGQVTLTYFTSCREETIDGGSLVVQATGSDLQGAARMDSRVISCLDLTARLTIPDGGKSLDRWKEWSIKTYEPLFLLPPDPPVEGVLRLVLLDGEQPGEVWRATVDSNPVRYPSRAVLLEGGVPYLAELLDADGHVVGRAVFSVDQDLDVTANASNSLVPLSPDTGHPEPGGSR